MANGTLNARDPLIWGEGTNTCASDSKHFGAWDQNLTTQWHIRYGGRGVIIYWHVERKIQAKLASARGELDTLAQKRDRATAQVAAVQQELMVLTKRRDERQAKGSERRVNSQAVG